MRGATAFLVFSLAALVSVGAQAQPFAGGSAQMPARGKPFSVTVTVVQVQEGGQKTPVTGATVILEARAGKMVVTKKTATTGEDGVGKFETLQSIKGVIYVPTVAHGGVSFNGLGIVPPEDGSPQSREVVVYGVSGDDSKVVVKELITAVELWEDQFLITQTWSFENRAEVAFDATQAEGEKYNDGLLIRTPSVAKGIHAQVIRGRGDVSEARVVEDKVWVRAPVPPASKGQEPLRVRLQFSIDHNSDTIEFDQPMLYNVEYSEIIVPLGTRFKKIPTLDLEMTAAGFNVAARKLRSGDNGLVAIDGKHALGSALRFRIEGYPTFRSPISNLTLFLLLAILVGGAVMYYREVHVRRGGRTQAQQHRVALDVEREVLFDALGELEIRYDEGLVSDRAYDIEAGNLRERLALVLRHLMPAEEDSATP
jgi:hypothetical protein